MRGERSPATYQRSSLVSSGWKAVASSCPCLTATATFSSDPDSEYSAKTCTAGPVSTIAGARMNTARKVGGVPSSASSGGMGSSVSKLFSCDHRIGEDPLPHATTWSPYLTSEVVAVHRAVQPSEQSLAPTLLPWKAHGSSTGSRRNKLWAFVDSSVRISYREHARRGR